MPSGESTSPRAGGDRLKRSAGLLLLFLLAVLYWLGFSMLRPMLSLYFNDAGYAMGAIGALMALHALIPVLLAMPAGQLIDRIGPRRSSIIGGLIMAFSGICYIAGGLTSTLFPMIVGQLSNGIGSLLLWGALQASVGRIARGGPEASGNRMLSQFAFANALAQFGGPVAGGWLADLGGFLWVFVYFALLSLICGLLAFRVPDAARPRPDGGATADLSLSLRNSYGSGIELLRHNRRFARAMLYNGMLFILVDIQGTFLPVLLADRGYTNTEIGTLLSVGGIASIAIRPIAGLLINRLGQHGIMMGSLWSGCGCMIALTLDPGYWGIAAILFVWGLGAGLNQPIALIIVASTVTADRQGMGMSLRTMVNRLVQIVNPVAIGGISALIGLSYSFGVIAAALMAFGMSVKKAS